MMQDNVHRYFATTVGLITTDGKWGQNVMAAEWTMHVSYEPMLIAISIHDSPTLWNIKDREAFGVNIASDDQAALVNIAGGYSGTEIVKLAIPGTFQTYRGSTGVPMLKGCALACECKLVSVQDMGDHVLVIGEALSAEFDEKKYPLIYTRGNYRRLGAKLPSGRKVVRVTETAYAGLAKMAAGQFVLKCAVAQVKSGRKTLYVRSGRSWALPMVAVKKGADYRKALASHLASLGVHAEVKKIAGMQRVTVKSGKQSLRANFIVFSCTAKAEGDGWLLRSPRGLLLKGLLTP
ncbi:flavin reductase family protein [Candidatus Nitrososphaera sp. FF02]|uniref:flavin reductase family protein n=1 Tax=Candidatus Nitrososphaera sp. FF02 TaxID=3398226 RepID=UPI0039EA5C2A